MCCTEVFIKKIKDFQKIDLKIQTDWLKVMKGMKRLKLGGGGGNFTFFML